MKLHFAPRTRAVRIAWLLEEMGLDYTLVRYELGHPSMRSPEFREIHPMGRVPVLEDGDVRIFESGAIMEYLLTRHGGETLKPAPDNTFFPDYLQWFHYCEGMVMPPINTLTVETILLPPERRTEINVKRATKLLGQMLVPIDTHLAENQYMAGDFSAADIMIASAVQSATTVNIDFNALPNLMPYLDRMAARPAFQTAAAL